MPPVYCMTSGTLFHLPLPWLVFVPTGMIRLISAKQLEIFGRAWSIKRLHELLLFSQLAMLVAAFFGWLEVAFITKGSYKIKPWGYVFKNRCLERGHKICTSQKRAVQ